jgi:hypothetical protein
LAACLPALFWLLWKNLPGMSGMRVPHRFFPFVALALAFAAGSGLDLLRRRTRSGAARGLLVAAFSVVIVVEQLPRLRSWMPYPEEPDFPPYSRFLAGAADVSSYVELPMFGDWHDLTTMYLGTSHWKPLVNGSSSYLPYERELLTRACARIDPECLDRLRAWRVSHLVARYWMPEDVRGKRRRKADRKEFLSWGPRLAELERSGLLVRVFADELGSVYRFDWERAVDQPAAASAPRDAAASSRASGTVN